MTFFENKKTTHSKLRVDSETLQILVMHVDSQGPNPVNLNPRFIMVAHIERIAIIAKPPNAVDAAIFSTRHSRLIVLNH